MLCLLFKVSIIFGNEIDTLSLLTGGNKKYWERIDSQNVIDNYGIVFCVDSTLEWYDKNRTIHFTSPQDELFKKSFEITNGKMYISYRVNCDKSAIIDTLCILKITEDSLVITVNEENNGMLIFAKSKDQRTKEKPWVNPDPRMKSGFTPPVIQNADLLTEIIDSIISWVNIRGDPYPESFKVRYKIRIDKNGFIQHISYLDEPSLLNSFYYFYSLLFEKIKELRFYPAMNNNTNEIYEYEWVLPIIYNP